MEDSVLKVSAKEEAVLTPGEECTLSSRLMKIEKYNSQKNQDNKHILASIKYTKRPNERNIRL